MLPILETERLVLCERTLDHLDDCLAMDLDPEVVKYIRPTPPEAEHRAFLYERLQLEHGENLGYWSIFEKDEQGNQGDFIGWILLVPLAGEGPEIEIGYRFVQRAWGKGYATEASLAVRDHGFATVGLEEICGVTNPENLASQNVLQKIGLKRQGERFAYGVTLPYFLMKKSDWPAVSSE